MDKKMRIERLRKRYGDNFISDFKDYVKSPYYGGLAKIAKKYNKTRQGAWWLYKNIFKEDRN
jgi:hypothetical protein